MRDAIFVSGDQASAYPAVVGLLAFLVEQARRDQALNEPAENVSDRLDDRGRDVCRRSCSLSEHVTLLELPTPLMQTLGEPTGRKSNTSPSCSKDFRVQAAFAVGDKSEHRSYRIICQRWSTMGGEPQQVSGVTESCIFSSSSSFNSASCRRRSRSCGLAISSAISRSRSSSFTHAPPSPHRQTAATTTRNHPSTDSGLASGQVVSNHRRRRC
jgi:hypothetical protein